jgi:DNA-binding beta-propeller fold protein YncE
VVNSLSNDLNFFRISRDGFLSPDGVVDVGVSQNNNPWAAAPDGRGHLLITNMLQNSISVFSIGSRAIEQTLPAGVAPEGIIVADGFAYVANTGTDLTYTFHEGSIWKYDLDSYQLVDSVQVGINPQDIQLDPLGRFHVVCTGNYADVTGDVHVIEPETLSLIMTIVTGGAPNHVAFAPDSTAYLSAGGWSGFGDPSGVVLQYRCETGEVIHGWESPIRVGFGASDIAVSQNGRVFVSCYNDNRVDELRADTVYATLAVGTGPSAIELLE